MRVELYEGVPISGTVLERRYDAIGSCTWVRFVDDELNEWAGIFGNGDLVKYCKAVLVGDGRTAFVIAGGQGYIVDAQTGAMHHKTDCDSFCDAISVQGRDFAIACDFTNLYAVASNGVVWSSQRIALDGIEFETATEALLTGKAWYIDGWYPFTLTFDGWHVQGDVVDWDWGA